MLPIKLTLGNEKYSTDWTHPIVNINENPKLFIGWKMKVDYEEEFGQSEYKIVIEMKENAASSI